MMIHERLSLYGAELELICKLLNYKPVPGEHHMGTDHTGACNPVSYWVQQLIQRDKKAAYREESLQAAHKSVCGERDALKDRLAKQFQLGKDQEGQIEHLKKCLRNQSAVNADLNAEITDLMATNAKDTADKVRLAEEVAKLQRQVEDVCHTRDAFYDLMGAKDTRNEALKAEVAAIKASVGTMSTSSRAAEAELFKIGEAVGAGTYQIPGLHTKHEWQTPGTVAVSQDGPIRTLSYLVAEQVAVRDRQIASLEAELQSATAQKQNQYNLLQKRRTEIQELNEIGEVSGREISRLKQENAVLKDKRDSLQDGFNMATQEAFKLRTDNESLTKCVENQTRVIRDYAVDVAKLKANNQRQYDIINSTDGATICQLQAEAASLKEQLATARSFHEQVCAESVGKSDQIGKLKEEIKHADRAVGAYARSNVGFIVEIASLKADLERLTDDYVAVDAISAARIILIDDIVKALGYERPQEHTKDGGKPEWVCYSPEEPRRGRRILSLIEELATMDRSKLMYFDKDGIPHFVAEEINGQYAVLKRTLDSANAEIQGIARALGFDHAIPSKVAPGWIGVEGNAGWKLTDRIESLVRKANDLGEHKLSEVVARMKLVAGPTEGATTTPPCVPSDPVAPGWTREKLINSDQEYMEYCNKIMHDVIAQNLIAASVKAMRQAANAHTGD